MWRQGLTRCQYGLFESQLQKAVRQEKKNKDSEAQQWFCRQNQEISTTVYEQGARCIENWVNGYAQRVVVSGMSPAGGQRLAVYPRGQYWPNHVQHLYKLCG